MVHVFFRTCHCLDRKPFSSKRISHPRQWHDIVVRCPFGLLFHLLQYLCREGLFRRERGPVRKLSLSTTAPVYIPIWAHFVLGETISLQAISGILTVVMGTYLIQLNSSIAHFRLKKISFRNKAVRYALFAGFLYSFGAIADKIGVMRSNFFVFTSCVILLMFSYFTAVVLSSSRLRADLFQSYRTSPFRVMLSGVALYISFYLFRYALSITEVSYAASVRQVASLFGVFLGIYILKEPYGRIRLIATLFIILGIVLITLG
jgi:uncharacterized membrane protein